MFRYYAIATGLVFTIAVAVTAFLNRDLIRIKIASTNLRVPAKSADALGLSGVVGGALRGDAPWALSALPDCLRQRAEASGPPAFVRAYEPKAMIPVPPGSTLHYGNCTIFVTDGEAYVTRGPDRLRIPPHVQFYRAHGLLALLRTSDAGWELRVYEPVH
ncbi:MAG: hypothetical protein M3R51_07770 [Candidatus Eremiobacteraeota bacterium]|nr:hypothetical protein [Candidatus Eremiobacteraeota bacterium]